MTRTELIEQKILQVLWELNRELGQVFSYEVAAELDKSPRTARYHLKRLEQAGWVRRPYGKQSGWVAA